METSKVQIKSQEVTHSPEPRIDVCITTYKRPELLRKLLQSLITQETMGEFSYRIIVVDNDVRRSAEEIVNQFSEANQKITYDVEPQQNISLARNRSLRLATGDYIAIIDDDDYAERHWLLNLCRTLISYDADVVHGPVISIFPEGTARHITQNTLFRQSKLVTGAPDKHTGYTSNSLFRRKLIEQITFPFDPDFGRTGGGDILFFRNLKMRGCKFIWCSDAPIFESIPPERASLFWILKRFFRNGNITYRMRDKPDEKPILDRLRAIILSCTKLVTPLCLLPFYSVGSIFYREATLKAIKNLEQIAFQLGFMLSILNFRYEEYRSKQDPVSQMEFQFKKKDS